MAKWTMSFACVIVLIAGQTFAQNFPAKPLSLLCPCVRGTAPEQHLEALAKLASKHLGQTITIQYPPRPNDLGLGNFVQTAHPDGYSLSMLPIFAYRVPHLQRVPWHPINDFTYVIGLAGYTFGVVVRADSQFKSLGDLIAFAKVNPGSLRYGAFPRASTQHLAMEELGSKTGARLLHVPELFPEAVKALIDGRIMAISENSVWGPYVEAGTLRLLVTFGEKRSRWNAPTAKELGFDILAYSPFGIVGPKGMDPKVTKFLHNAFNRALDDPGYDKLLQRLDMVDWYKSSEDYADWAVDQMKFQRDLIQRTIGLGN